MVCPSSRIFFVPPPTLQSYHIMTIMTTWQLLTLLWYRTWDLKNQKRSISHLRGSTQQDTFQILLEEGGTLQMSSLSSFPRWKDNRKTCIVWWPALEKKTTIKDVQFEEEKKDKSNILYSTWNVIILRESRHLSSIKNWIKQLSALYKIWFSKRFLREVCYTQTKICVERVFTRCLGQIQINSYKN